MSQRAQSFENHAEMVPLYHYFTFALLLALLAWSIRGLVVDLSFDRVMLLVLVLALLMVFFFARVFALGTQDRIIRLEERLRMAQVLPEDLRARIGEFSTADLIVLRFAPDGELPELARRVLNGEFATPKDIKRAVTNWRADHQRI